MFKFKALGLLLVVALTAGCSSNDSSSSTSVVVNVQSGHEDISDALLRVAAIGASGLPDRDAELRLNSVNYVTDAEGNAEVLVSRSAMTLFQLVTREADEDRDQLATAARCQWVAGCAGGIAFGAAIAPAAYEWRSVAYDLARNERIRVTPFTELAAALAYEFVYAENAAPAAWQPTGFYSPYSIEQAISQVSKIFGIQNVQTTEPADLTEINEWSSVAAVTARDSIRYGALLAAWAHLEETTPGFTASVVEEFITNSGQVTGNGSATLTLQSLYSLAIANLEEEALSVTNVAVQGYVADVITQLQQDLTAAEAMNADALTAISPATLETLFGESGSSNFQLGIQRSKAFIATLREEADVWDNFFEEGYSAKLQTYGDLLKSIGDLHKENLDALILAFRNTQSLYLDTFLDNACPADLSSYISADWSVTCSYDAASSTMTLTGSGNTITVTQAVADVNTTDSDDTPASSQAIDVLIRGTYQINNLRFVVNHVYENDKEADGILSPSGVRVYFSQAVSELADPDDNEILAYEVRWSDFALYDSAADNTASESELTGNFRMLFRGVADPLGVSERRFNIDEVVLNSRISDVIGDDSETDTEFSTLYVASRSSNSRYYYPEQEFSGFNGFFNPQAAVAEGSVENNLVGYELGQETVRGLSVEYFDFLVPSGESRRYRFYPTVKRADALDVDKDTNRTELIDSHDFEICELSDSGASRAITGCNPAQRLYTARNVQQAINDLWEAGVFSRVSIQGEGEYFVEWPATEVNGCYQLDTLQTVATSFAGTLHRADMMGLDTLRVTTEVRLDDEPRTLLDVLISARSAERYSVSAALSHDYSVLNNGTVVTGSGSDVDRLILSVDTDSNLRANSSLSVYKSGVALQLDEDTTSTINSELIAAAREEYPFSPLPYRYITGKDGGYDLCVLENAALPSAEPELDDQVFSLTFRGVVYGTLRNESGVWIVRYLDGQFEAL